MTIRHMRIFMAVYQEMSVTKAAGRLHMTQPAVTRAVRELEGYYGVRLFDRINHRLFRTQSGDELYARALHIVETFDDLEKEIKNWDELGVLRVGGSVTIGNFVLPDVISRFQERHPHLRIKVMISNAQSVRQAVLENRLDLALIEGSVSDGRLAAETLSQNRLCLILPPKHPLLQKDRIFLKDLAQYPLLLRENGSAGRDFLNHVFAAHGIDMEPMWESASTQALIRAVAVGLGISILPEMLVLRDVKSGTVISRPVEDEPFVRENQIIWHRQKFLTNAAKEWIALCRSFLA